MEQATYRLVRSRRRTIAIQILPDGTIVVRCPLALPPERIEAFVNSKYPWIAKQLSKLPEPVQKFTDAERKELMSLGASRIPLRVAYFAPLVGVSYGRISIRCQRTRWGSCSSKGNLNFNYLLMLAPPEVLDYVVVHELCHRKELNHSAQFWSEVARVMPGYDACRKWLKNNGAGLIARLP